MEADEDHQNLSLMRATSANARVMIVDSSRVISRGYWFYLYKARTSSELQMGGFHSQASIQSAQDGNVSLNSNPMEMEHSVHVSQPDYSVRGKGLASASGVKRPSFQLHQAVVGGSLRSTLKRARAGDSDDSSSAATSEPEQAGDAEHTRPEK
ncbi:hypothetical protein CsatA_025577 [Cannabis sativa]